MKRYRAESADAVSRASLEGITLIYHHASGQTHLVVSPVPEILEMLTDEPLSIEELGAKLSLRYDLGVEEEAQAELTEHVAALTAIGLVRSA